MEKVKQFDYFDLNQISNTKKINSYMKLQKNIKAVIVNGDESGFVAECLEFLLLRRDKLSMKLQTILKRLLNSS